jgi:hypothetical protein
MTRYNFNDEWLKSTSIVKIKKAYKGDKMKLNLALQRRKELQ